jgi:brefeldin A-inhibited guanine nucleotide-exchange protein
VKHQAIEQTRLTSRSLATEIIKDFILIDPETQPRNVAAWTPVVTDIIRGAIDFDESAFEEHLAVLYPLICDLLGKELAPEMRLSVRDYLKRVGTAKRLV